MISRHNLPGLLGAAVLLIFSSISQAVPSAEKKLMEDARLAFETGKLERALELYEKIPQSSDYWIEALEERAWTYLRLNENSKALALATTLTSEFLAPQVGPEPYFMRSLINYRLCNIKGIFQDFDLIKKRFRKRGEELEKLKNTGANSASGKVIQILFSQSPTHRLRKADDFGPGVQFMPRYFYRDRTILAALETRNEQRLEQRLRQLATEEVQEIETINQKLKLLESQVVQQVITYSKELQKKRKVDFSAKDRNTMVFPVSNDEAENWVDEIDKLEAATADCPVDPLKGLAQ